MFISKRAIHTSKIKHDMNQKCHSQREFHTKKYFGIVGQIVGLYIFPEEIKYFLFTELQNSGGHLVQPPGSSRST